MYGPLCVAVHKGAWIGTESGVESNKGVSDDTLCLGTAGTGRLPCVCWRHCIADSSMFVRIGPSTAERVTKASITAPNR